MRICFFGTPEPAVPSLRALVAEPAIEIVRVVTNPDRPAGRGHKLQPSPVKVAAAEAGLEVWQPERPKTIGPELADLRVDACAIVAYGAILPPEVIAAAGAGFVNLHFSLLPAWRGAAPVAHAILNGDTETGVSCFLLEEGMDTGPVLTERRTSIGADETAGELTARLAEMGAPALVEAVTGLVDGSLTPQPQPAEGVSYAPKIAPDHARLAWREHAEALHRAVRAFNPVPGAHTTLRAERLKVHRAQVVDHGSDPAPGTATGIDAPAPSTATGTDGVTPGTVTSIDAATGSPIVACGRGALRLDEVQPAGKARMSGSSFVNGYQPQGAVLGEDPAAMPDSLG